jgi:hypothetical protein
MVGISVAQLYAMDLAEVATIARSILRDYGLPLRFETVASDQPGRCIVGFSDRYRPAAVVAVALWHDAKASSHSVRESLKRGLQVND